MGVPEVEIDAEVTTEPTAPRAQCTLQIVACEEEEEEEEHSPQQCETSDDVHDVEADDGGGSQTEAEICTICLDTVTDGFRTPCGHAFCSSCLAQALFRNDSCPVCRSIGVHTCASFKADCSLCVAGHKPGVVIPNVFVSEFVLHSPYTSSAREITLIWLQVTFLATILLIAGFACVVGVLPFPAFGVLCALVTLANFFLVLARFRRLQRIRAQVTRRGRRGVRPGPAVDYDVEQAPNAVIRTGGVSAGGVANSAFI